jgi:hypothetical protein
LARSLNSDESKHAAYTSSDIRQQIVQFISDHSKMGNSTLFEIDQIVPDQVVYLENMRKNGTYGDHVTLQAAAELFNVQMIVLSSKGNLYN